MAASLLVQQSHATSHPFRQQSAYQGELQSQMSRENHLLSRRSHPYHRERSCSPAKKSLSFRSRHPPASPFYQRDRERSPVSVLKHRRIDSSTSDSFGSTSDQHPKMVTRLVNENNGMPIDPRIQEQSHRGERNDPVYPPFQQASPYAPQGTLAQAPNGRGLSDSTDNGRLPGIVALLNPPPAETHRNDQDQRYTRSLGVTPAVYSQPSVRHSYSSSRSSMLSEPVSPHSSNSHHQSRSPRLQQSYYDDRGRPAYLSERQSHSYEQSRSSHVPSLPSHSSPYHQHERQAPPPPPPPRGDVMLPPPPDPYYNGNQYTQQPLPQYNLAQQHAVHLINPYDRPRMDSVIHGMDGYPMLPNGHYPQSSQYPPTWNGYSSSSMARKRRGNLPKEATKILKEWFQGHEDSPYPTEDDKQELCRATRLQISQVNNWFINARRRMPRETARRQIEDQQRGVTADSTGSSENTISAGETSQPSMDPSGSRHSNSA